MGLTVVPLGGYNTATIIMDPEVVDRPWETKSKSSDHSVVEIKDYKDSATGMTFANVEFSNWI